MRRCLRVIGALLVLATVINAVVAWSCSRWASFAPWKYDSTASIVQGDHLAVYRTIRWNAGAHVVEDFPIESPAEFFHGMPEYLTGNQLNPQVTVWPTEHHFGWPTMTTTYRVGEVPAKHSVIINARGWPFPAFAHRGLHDFSKELERASQTPYSGGPLSPMMMLLTFDRWDTRAIRNEESNWPMWPVWPGFLLNTAAYFVALMALTMACRLCVRCLAVVRPRGRVPILLMALIFGAVLTVIVAWGCAVLVPLHGLQALNNDDVGRSFGWFGANQVPFYDDWWIERNAGFGSARFESWWDDAEPMRVGGGLGPATPAEAILPSWGDFMRPHSTGSTGQNHTIFVDARGWPMLALYWMSTGSSAFGAPRSLSAVQWGLPIGSEPIGGFRHRQGDVVPRALPLAPLWWGFVVDAACYSVVSMLVWAAVFSVTIGRRRWRLDRRLCPRCKYPIGTSHVCTECGTSLPASEKVRSEDAMRA